MFELAYRLSNINAFSIVLQGLDYHLSTLHFLVHFVVYLTILLEELRERDMKYREKTKVREEGIYILKASRALGFISLDFQFTAFIRFSTFETDSKILSD